MTHTLEDLIAYCKRKMADGGKPFTIYRDLADLLIGMQTEPSNALYTAAIAAYDAWLKETIGVGVKMDGVEGKAMKAILAYLLKESKDKTDAGVLASWQYILSKWHMQNEFIGKQKKLAQINKNLIEILDNIRNGNSKAKQQLNQSAKEQLKRDIKNR